MKIWRDVLILGLVILAGLAFYFFVSLSNRPQTYEGTDLTGKAGGFQLTDQNNATVKLSDFRGKVVVLTFMDSKGTDTCPITAVHFREVYRQLTHKEKMQVVFLAVNVNVDESDVADMLETTRGWHLDEIPSWHFLTGSQEVLEPVWKEYGVSAAHNHDSTSIMHTSGTFLIDPLGQKRWYVSTPFSDNTDLSLSLSDLLLKHIRGLLPKA